MKRLRARIAYALWRLALRLADMEAGLWVPLRPHSLAPEGYKFGKVIRESGVAEWTWSRRDDLAGGGDTTCSGALRSAWRDWAYKNAPRPR